MFGLNRQRVRIQANPIETRFLGGKLVFIKISAEPVLYGALDRFQTIILLADVGNQDTL